MLDTVSDHVRVEMTAGASVDLVNRNPGGRDSIGIIAGLLVPFEHGEIEFILEIPKGSFKDGGLAAAGGTDQIQRQ